MSGMFLGSQKRNNRRKHAFCQAFFGGIVLHFFCNRKAYFFLDCHAILFLFIFLSHAYFLAFQNCFTPEINIFEHHCILCMKVQHLDALYNPGEPSL